MRVIYVAGKFRGKNAWEIENHVRLAEEAAFQVWMMGAAALCPHTNSRFFHGAAPDRLFIDGTLELLRRCDAVYCCPGWEASAGTRGEINEAMVKGLPVFYSLDDLEAWLGSKR